MNPYVTIYGPYPLTWREALTATLKARLKPTRPHNKGDNPL